MALYGGSNVGTYFVFDMGKVESRLLGSFQMREEEDHLRWEFVVAVTLWGLQSCICKSIFQGMHELATEVIKAIWNDLLHVLKGEWNLIQGTLE